METTLNGDFNPKSVIISKNTNTSPSPSPPLPLPPPSPFPFWDALC